MAVKNIATHAAVTNTAATVEFNTSGWGVRVLNRSATPGDVIYFTISNRGSQAPATAVAAADDTYAVPNGTFLDIPWPGTARLSLIGSVASIAASVMVLPASLGR